MGYTKLFEELIRSSIWAEDNTTRIVWITMLATKDRNHFVRGTEEWLAGAARVSLEECRKALGKLSSPDPASHCELEEGRRVRAVAGGWHIVSGERYAAKLNQAERLEYKAAKQREYRRRRKELVEAAGCDGGREAIRDGLAEVAGASEEQLGAMAAEGLGKAVPVVVKGAGRLVEEAGETSQGAAPTVPDRDRAKGSAEAFGGRGQAPVDPVDPGAGSPGTVGATVAGKAEGLDYSPAELDMLARAEAAGDKVTMKLVEGAAQARRSRPPAPSPVGP